LLGLADKANALRIIGDAGVSIRLAFHPNILLKKSGIFTTLPVLSVKA